MAQALLVGLDVGSTTSHAMVATAEVVRSGVGGRMELGRAATVYRSEPVFTPFVDERIDEDGLGALVDGWLGDAHVDPRAIAGGGVIVTGLAAQAANARAVTELLRARLGDAVIAVADDPCLESWLAFLGSCRALSRAQPGVAFCNLDIGGGTTNVATGRDGEVTRTGCWFVGARHVQVVPGTYRIVALSRQGRGLLDHLGIAKAPGDVLSADDVAAIVGFYVELLEACVAAPSARPFPADVVRLHEQVAFELAGDGDAPPVITLSGGVGELVYRRARGEARRATTLYGDLGIDLAERILRSPILSRDLATHTPEGLGRATVQGLTLHATQVSGATIFLPRPGALPLRDLPIVARLEAGAPPARLRAAIELARRSGRGACIELGVPRDGVASGASVKELGRELARALRETGFPPRLPLVLFVAANVGKTIGYYATEWRRLDVELIVIDELVVSDACFASLGPLRDGVVPVSFHGMRGATAALGVVGAGGRCDDGEKAHPAR